MAEKKGHTVNHHMFCLWILSSGAVSYGFDAGPDYKIDYKEKPPYVRGAVLLTIRTGIRLCSLTLYALLALQLLPGVF